MDCVVTAGGLPTPEDPLYAYTSGKSKALLDMGGRTMLERVVDALQSAKHIENIVIVGLGSDLGMQFQRPVHHLPDQGSLIGNVLAGINWLREEKPDTELVVISSADIPLVTGEIIDQFIESCRPFDKGLYYNFVTKATMETRFPNSNRTFTKLKDDFVAGGDMLLAHSALADSHHDLWHALTHARKHAWQLARVVGFRFLLKLLLRQLSIADIEETAARLIGYPSQVILNTHAEIAMDADKPHQVDMLRAELEAVVGD